jgi:hypothetical protein
MVSRRDGDMVSRRDGDMVSPREDSILSRRGGDMVSPREDSILSRRGGDIISLRGGDKLGVSSSLSIREAKSSMVIEGEEREEDCIFRLKINFY